METNNQRHVPSSHYHLGVPAVLGIALIPLCIIGTVFFLALADDAVPPPVLRNVQEPLPSVHESIDVREILYVEQAIPIEATTILLSYPNTYTLIQHTDTSKDHNSLSSYMFWESGQGNTYPAFADIAFYTRTSILDPAFMAQFDAEKEALRTLSQLGLRHVLILNERPYLVENIEQEGGGTISSYIGFFDDLRVAVAIAMSSPSESMQADELFRLLHMSPIVSEASAGELSLYQLEE